MTSRGPVLPCAALLAAVVLAPATPTQNSVTVPATLTAIEGGSGTGVPFGVGQPVRYQCLYDAQELPWTGPRIISTVSIRADNGNPGTTSFAAKGFVVMTMALSTSALKAENITTTFDDNHGRDRTRVFTSVPHMLPAQPAQAGVRAANIDLVLPVPWIYGMTPVRNNNQPAPDSLVVELQIESQPPGAYRIDNTSNCSATPTTFGTIGPQCAHLPAATPTNPFPSRLPTLNVVPGPSLQAGSPYTWTVENAPPNAAVFLSVSLTNQGAFLGQSLPVPLFDPANPSSPNPPGLFWSAPDCWVHVAPAATLLGISDTNGNMAVSVGIAAGRAFVGESLFVQALAYSQTANPLQVIASAGAESTVCGPLGIARLYQFGNATAQTGQLSRGQGAVLELR